MNFIITIGREYGSGGREIGMKLSEELGCPLFDKEIINEAVSIVNYLNALMKKHCPALCIQR